MNKDELKQCEIKEDTIDSIMFCVSYQNNKEEILRISKDGFYYKGERVDDIHNVYERFNNWLSEAENKNV